MRRSVRQSLQLLRPPWKPSNCKRNILKSHEMRCSTLLTASSTSLSLLSFQITDESRSFVSALHTDTPGRVDKSTVLHSLQSSGESYDRARETLKHVSVDASGKVELEDWVEVRFMRDDVTFSYLIYV